MQEPILSIENLSHRYSRSWAIRDISFAISKTGVVGLLGSNGAGKSTTMNILCGVLNQTRGQVFINGTDLRKEPEKVKQQIGFLPQTPPLHYDLTVDEYLTHCAWLRRMDKRSIAPAVEKAMAKCGVAHFRKRLLRNLSGGYRQRVGIAQAIIHEPGLVVLDEPTNGLDPNQIVEVRKLIREIAEERAVVFSTHILSEVQALCREIKMIEQGRIVFADTMEAFNNYIRPDSLLVQWANPPAEQQLLAIKGIIETEFLNPYTTRLRFDAGVPDISERVVEAAIHGGWRLREINYEKSSLDATFARLSQSATTMEKQHTY